MRVCDLRVPIASKVSVLWFLTLVPVMLPLRFGGE